MTTEEDVKKERDEDAPDEESGDAPRADAPSEEEQGEGAEPTDEPKADALARDVNPAEEGHDVAEVGEVGAVSPTQLGTRRWVYAGYFAGAIAIAFLMSKIVDFAWFKLQGWKPVVGEPKDEIVMPASALVGALAAVYFWYRTRARQLAEEVAGEMAKVKWPTRTEVTNGTFVVIVTTIVSTVFFALMDKFWGFVTNLVYGGT
jgi:preprotein translocase subunit SecE